MIPQLKGFYQNATPQDFLAAADASSGDVLVNEGRVGVVLDDVEAGEAGVYIVGTDVRGIEMPHAAVAAAKDEKAYWDEDGNPNGGVAGSGAVTNVEAGNLYLGRFAEPAGAGDAVAVVELVNA